MAFYDRLIYKNGDKYSEDGTPVKNSLLCQCFGGKTYYIMFEGGVPDRQVFAAVYDKIAEVVFERISDDDFCTNVLEEFCIETSIRNNNPVHDGILNFLIDTEIRKASMSTAEKWRCLHCGYADNTAKLCMNCASPKPEGSR